MPTEPTPYDAAILDLEGRIQHFQTMLDGLKQLRSQIGGGPISSQNGGRGHHDNEILHDTFFGMTIGDATNKFLKMAKVTKSTADIAEALEKGGLKHSSKDFPTTVRSVLGGREDFLRVNGDWGLTEWYPGMRSKDRKAKPIASAENTPIADEMKGKHSKPETDKPKRVWMPTGYGKGIVELLAPYPDKVYYSADVAQQLGTDKIPSIASLLSNLAIQGRIGRGEKFGYRANEETIQALQRLRAAV